MPPSDQPKTRAAERSGVTHAFRELQRRQRQLADAQRVAGVGSWEWDIEANVVTWTDELYRIVGLDADSFDATYQAYLACVHPEDRARIDGIVTQALHDHKPFAFDHRVVKPDRSERIVHGRGEILLNADGIPTRMIGTGQDITEIRHAQEEARKAREQAERANSSKTEFLARMSHELRTPLNAVIGFAQLLQMSEIGAEPRESVEHILRGGRHLLQLINEVLDISAIEQGRLDLCLEPVSVDEIVDEVLGLTALLATQQDVHLFHELIPSGVHVTADRQRLKQVLLNLVSNAIKYNREHGEVRIAVEQACDRRARISVIDTGHGIAPDKLDRLFCPFERLGAERTAVEGTGIGLALSQLLTELMGGDIEVHSVPGQGSRFTVQLPRAWPPAADADGPDPGQPVHPEPSGAGRRSVLCVEDNPTNLRLIEGVLARRPNLQLLLATRGRLGLELAARHRPDLILLDVHLPDIDGHEVLRLLRDDPATSNVPVVAVSAEATPLKIDRFLAAGARAYITKPLDVPRFLGLIDELLAEPAKHAGGGAQTMIASC